MVGFPSLSVKEFVMQAPSVAAVSRKWQNAAWLPFAALFIGLIAVSSSSIFIRFSQNAGAGSLVIAMWRCLLAALILTPFVLARNRPALARLTRREWFFGVLSGLFLAAHFASWITSLEYTSVLTSTTLVTTNPLIVALLTPFLLREKLRPATLVAIVLAIAGVFLISITGGAGRAPRQDNPTLGIVLALVGSVSVAGYYIAGRRLRTVLPVIPYIWLSYGVAGLALLLIALPSGQPIVGLSGEAYLWMTLTALVPQLIGHSSFNFALGYLSAAFVSLVVLGEPVMSSVLAIFLLNEPLIPDQLWGVALVLVALVVASQAEARAERAQRQARAAQT
jgi:drug/metabolite transporter (DMT)-like permease